MSNNGSQYAMIAIRLSLNARSIATGPILTQDKAPSNQIGTISSFLTQYDRLHQKYYILIRRFSTIINKAHTIYYSF